MASARHVVIAGAMARPVGRTITARGFVRERDARDLATGAATHDADCLRHGDQWRESVGKAKADEDARGVGRELQPCAGLEEFR